MTTIKIQSIAELENDLEEMTTQFENSVGFKKLIQIFDGNPHSQEFISRYQQEIRQHITEWPYNDNIPLTSFSGFQHRYNATTKKYVENAIHLFNFLQNPNPTKDDLCLAYEIVVLSEAMRGREGKRSSIGLDYLQENFLTELEKTIDEIHDESLGDKEEIINTIAQTILSGHSSAQELQEKFIAYIEINNQELTIENVEEIDVKTNGLCRRILRHFCGYSMTKFNKQLKSYQSAYIRIKQKPNNVIDKQDIKISLTAKIADRLQKKDKDVNNFYSLLQNIDTLNFLNDNLDVKFSFKSWAGLIHWSIISRAIEVTGNDISISERLILLNNNGD